MVPANDAGRVCERLEEVYPVVDFERPGKVRIAASVAAVIDLSRRVRVDGVGHSQVENVASDDPDEHEHAEGDVAGELELEVFQDLGTLCGGLDTCNTDRL